MAKKKALKGENLMLWIDGACVELSTSCKFTYSAVTNEGDTKDDAENSIEIDHFTMNATNSSQLLTTDAQNRLLLSTMKAKTKVTCILGIPSNDSEDEVPEGGWTAPTSGLVSFEGYITEFSVDASKGSKATGDITITGVGEITIPSA